jgi:uncharacterized membrane protein
MSLPASTRYMLLIELLLAAALLAVMVSPLTLPEASVPDLDGDIGKVDNWEELRAMPWPQMIVYLIGDVNCHQQADRSYELNGNQLPICARDLGLLAGAVVGLAAFMAIRRPVRWLALGLLLLPMAVDGGLQAMAVYESSNLLRTITGAVAGVAAGWGVGMLVQAFFVRGDRPQRPSEVDGQQ